MLYQLGASYFHTDGKRERMEIYDGGAQARKKGWAKYLLQFLNGNPRTVLVFLVRQSSNDKASREAGNAFCATLRSLVDEWIDSGKKGSEEQPSKRTIPLDALNGFIARNPARFELSPRGRLRLCTWPLLYEQTDLLVRARDGATHYFLVLLDSPEPTRLSRCDECGTYFMRTRAPKKETPIYHGTFCADCKNKGGARRTVESRKQRTKKRIDWAADAWVQWKP